MKRIISFLLALILLFSFVGCGEIVETNKGKGTEVDENVPSTKPGTGEESESLASDSTAFSVALRLNGEQYFPSAKDNIIAEWTDGFHFYTAEFGKDGYARVKELDGDFDVTLKNLPDKYVYNPNAYVASNSQGKRAVVIDIYTPIKTRGNGTHEFDCIKIKELGVYKAVINGAGRENAVFYEYAPPTEGTYAVESWMSTAEGEYNPSTVIYTANAAYKKELYVLHDGGYSDGYTKNFKYIVEIAKENISESGGGAAVFTFAIYLESKNDNFPVNVDFAITRNGSFYLDHEDKELIVSDMPLEQMNDYDPSEYEWKWAETETRGVDGRYEFDGTMFKLWSLEEGGDGYYHLYNSETGEYGEILYAKISEAHRFTAEPFTVIEAAGNSCLTVNGYQNYKLFIEGIADLIRDPFRDNWQNNPSATHGSYFCDRFCPCREEDRTCTGVCPESCMKCTKNCRKLPDEIVATMIMGAYYCSDSCPCFGEETTDLGKRGHQCYEDCTKCTSECKKLPLEAPEGWTKVLDVNDRYMYVDNRLLGLAHYANSDGVYAVTEQIRDFLQGFSTSQRYFADGDGWVETHETYKVDASEDDQWLFACGYYVKKTA